MFKNSERRFYQQLNNEDEQNKYNAIPDADESKQFWSEIRAKEVQHNRRAEWLNDFKNEMENSPTQRKVETTEPKVKKMLNWKEQGPDGVQGF